MARPTRSRRAARAARAVALGALGAAALPALAPRAAAAQDTVTVLVTCLQVGPDVVATGFGSLDRNTPTTGGTAAASPASVAPPFAFIVTGAGATPRSYTGIGELPAFGPGGQTFATTSTGDLVLLSGVNENVGLPFGYIAGAPLTNQTLYAGATFAMRGRVPSYARLAP